MSWSALAAGAPELARLGAGRVDGKVAFLGTLRRDGSPRVSGVEPVLAGGELVLGVMAGSLFARDLRGDARCMLQSVVVTAGDPELKVYGRVEPWPARAGWWASHPPGAADVYRLLVDEARHVEWDLPGGRMRVRRWTPAGGETVTERPYP